MAGQERFVFTFVDLYGDKPNDTVSVLAKHTVLTNFVNVPKHDAGKKLAIGGLDSSNGGRYQVQIFPTRYRVESRLFRIKEDETLKHEFRLIPDPDKVTDVKFPSFDELGADLQNVLENSAVEGQEDQRGRALYDNLGTLRTAGLLNLYAKMKDTRFDDGRDSFSFVENLRRIRGERFFADVRKDLRDAVKNSMHSKLFEEVSGALHEPPPGFVSDDSFKSNDKAGNLQLTFFRKQDAIEFRIDADIDRSKGLEHLFDVVSHSITHTDTHPYDVHAILLVDQEIDTGYRLIV